MRPNQTNPLRSIEKTAGGLAAQIAEQVRVYFENEVKDLQEQATFLAQLKANRLQARTNSVEKAAQRVSKRLAKFI